MAANQALQPLDDRHALTLALRHAKDARAVGLAAPVARAATSAAVILAWRGGIDG
jgi:hypothetical protein